MFDKKQHPNFERLKEAIEQRMARPAVGPAVSAADEIRKLAALRQQGILTQEEFDAKKKQLLGG